MYSRLFKKKKDRKCKKKEDAYDEVLYTTLEGAFSLLHSLIGLNVPIYSIVPNYNPFLQFKVPYECSIAIGKMTAVLFFFFFFFANFFSSNVQFYMLLVKQNRQTILYQTTASENYIDLYFLLKT